MTVKAIFFDIGGVLEFDPDLGVDATWEAKLGLGPGELDARLGHLWEGGSIGAVSLDQVHRGIRDILGIDQRTIEAFMADLWKQYLGTLNIELYQYFRSLRPRYHTGIISNSFVGAREREQELYGFEDVCDVIVYSHECGVSKPDRRIYELAAQHFGVSLDEMVFLDNSETIVTAARQLGIKAVHFRGNAQAIAEIQAQLDA